MISEYDSLVDEARSRTKIASKDYIPKCCEILRKEGLSQEKITHRIRRDFGEIWSQQTIYEAIPDEYKKETKPKKIQPPESILVEQSSSGSVDTTETKHTLERKPEIEVPNPPMATADDLLDSDGIMRAGTEHDIIPLTNKTVRIVISGSKFNGLSKAMLVMVKENGLQVRYVIEYDPEERELYVDLAEKKEETNVND